MSGSAIVGAPTCAFFHNNISEQLAVTIVDQRNHCACWRLLSVLNGSQGSPAGKNFLADIAALNRRVADAIGKIVRKDNKVACCPSLQDDTAQGGRDNDEE